MSKQPNIFDRIDISSIFSQHLTTFYHYEKKQFHGKTEIPGSDKILFILFPLFLAVALCLVGLQFNKDYVNIALTCLSIFIGLLFGLLTMILSLIQENQKSKIENLTPVEKKKFVAKFDLTKHLFINIGFSIVLSILAIVFVLLTQFYPSYIITKICVWQYYSYLKDAYLYLTNGFSFFLLIEFFLAIMMIMRRFTVLFLNQISEESMKQE